MTFTDGAYYEGSFKDGHMHGRGMFVWNKAGRRYEGEIMNNFKYYLIAKSRLDGNKKK